MEQRLWFALLVRVNKERTTEKLLGQKGYETFLPVYKERRRWSDRHVIAEKPLFPGYVFCQFDARHRLPVLTTPGVLKVVGCGGTPVPIDETELSAVRSVTQAPYPYGPWTYLKQGEQVRIAEGPLEGLTGILLRIKNQYRLVVSVSLLERSVAVELDQCAVRAAGTARGSHTTA